MKHIGYIDGANTTPSTWKTHSLGMLAPHDLFIPNPGERENVDADRWRHIGWINPLKDGGVIWDSHADAAEYGDARPAYIASDKPVPVFQDGPAVVYNVGGKTDPMDVRRSEFEALRKEFMITVRRVQEIGRDLIDQRPEPAAPAEPPMTFYDHAFIAAYIAASATMNRDLATKNAHADAAHLTRNRVNRPT